LEPILLRSCTTVDRVERLSVEGAEYPRLDVRAKDTAAFGIVRTAVDGALPAIVRALLAAAPAVDRRASIMRVYGVDVSKQRGGLFHRLPQSNERVDANPKQVLLCIQLMKKAGEVALEMNHSGGRKS
jgi:hypothetical protein